MNATNVNSGNDGSPPTVLDEWIVAYERHLSRGGPAPEDPSQELSTEERARLVQARKALEALHDAFGKDRAPSNRPAAEPQQQLGDFRILHEIGRGGMGVVYEAEQVSMGRKVALKILPLAAILDQQRLDRFHNEVRAAATLDHPHCVPIYAVGEERGVHYYAMKLIRGQSLASVIDELRSRGAFADAYFERPAKTPSSNGHVIEPSHRDSAATANEARINGANSPAIETLSLSRSSRKREYFRRIAEMGAQAADALHHAHEQGVVHRDVKPGNLLLDVHGKLWVTDFGLARIEADAGMTTSADLLGTMRYMSPEQALGKRALADHRVDVYSLGATLYELLTLQPAVRGDDRAHVLKQFDGGSPVPPRKIDPSIPPELETIVGKAMQHAPADRYSTAAELADDLRRFLANEPIQARRTTVWQRCVKWTRRYPAWTALIAVVLLSLSALSIGSMWHARRLSRELAVNESLRAVAENQEAAMQRSRYLLDMQLAARSIDEAKYEDAKKRLDFYRPPSEYAADRDFPWYYLWDQYAKAVKEFPAHSDMIRTCTVAPRSNLVIAGGDDGVVRLFDLESGDLKAALEHFVGNVHAVAVTPDEKTLFTAGERGELLAWNLEEVVNDLGTIEPRGLEGHADDVLCLAVSPNGRFLASAGADGDVLLWELSSLQHVNRFEGHTEWIRGLDFSPDGKTLASISHDDFLILWDVDDAKEFQRVKVADGHRLGLCVRFHPSGGYLAAGNSSGEILVIDLRDLETISRYELPTSWIRSLDFSADGRALAASGNNPFVRIFDVDEQMQLAPRLMLRGHSSETWCVQFVEERRSLVSSGSDGTILLRKIGHADALISTSLAELEEIHDISNELHSRRLSTTQNRSSVVLASFHDTSIFDADDLAEKTSHGSPSSSPYGGVISPNGQWVGLLTKKQLRLFRANELDPGRTIRDKAIGSGRQQFTSIAFHPDGDVVGVGTLGGELRLMHHPTGKPIKTFQPFGRCRVADVVFSPNGRYVAACFCNRFESTPAVTVIWDTKSHVEWQRIEGVERILAVSPVDSLLAIVNRDRSIRLWNLESQATNLVLEGHSDLLGSGDFSPDGKYLLTSARTGPIKLWSVETGELMLDMNTDLYLPHVAFTSNRSAVATNLRVKQVDGKPNYDHDLVPLLERFAEPTSDFLSPLKRRFARD